MGIFPENPCEFAVEFIRRMRIHPDIVQIPSSRQVMSIPRLIVARYYRKGNITPSDFIEVSTVTSYPGNQDLAKQISFEILFPNYKKDLASSFFQEGSDVDETLEDDFLTPEEKSYLEEFQDLIDEIEMSKSVDTEFLQKIENFMEELNQKREEEPFKSALNFFPDETELYKEKITSLEELLNEAKRRFEQKINSLEPEDLKASKQLNLNDLIQEKSKRNWEKITSKALNNQDITPDLNDLMNSNNFEDFIQSLKYLSETNSLNEDQLQMMKDEIKNQIDNLEQLFQAAKNLGETPQFDQDKVLQNSLKKSSFNHNFNLANSLDQYFGTNLRTQLLDKYDQMAQDFQFTPSIENLTKNAFANKSWNDLLNRAIQNAVNEAMNQKKKFEEFKNLTHQMQQLSNSCANMHCSQKLAQQIPDIMKKSLEACENPHELKDTVEFLRKIGLKPNPEDIKSTGQKLGMPEEEIFELIEPNYQLLKKLIDKKLGDFERISNLMNQLGDQINKERMKELISSALASENRDALGALGHFDLEQALKAAQFMGGEEGQDKLIQCLGAGSGENLLKQWYMHRKNLTPHAKEKVKELAKKMLIELGIFYSRARLGSSVSGPIPINIVRPFAIGDDFENVDLEETINNILEKGKKLDHINYDDFFVYETAKGQRSACFELDISGSMSGEKLASMAISTTMLVYGMKKDELAITFFESDTHILKEMDEKIDLENLADELLMVSARGGTRIQKALEWARRQFKEKSGSREKLNVLFTDAEIYDLKQAMEELRIFRSMGIDFVLVVPETSFNLEDAKKIVKIAGGQLLTIKDWNEFPDLISEIIKSKF
ncbi:MAG: VWA domain-containing protein [Promethearchaeota archaeon]|nr:MAG: VWA domain-containing protein [Candidatus Lokiarchaeota archaeon]